MDETPAAEESEKDGKAPAAEENIVLESKKKKRKRHTRKSSSVQWRQMAIEELWYPPPGLPGYTPSGMADARRIVKDMDEVVNMRLNDGEGEGKDEDKDIPGDGSAEDDDEIEEKEENGVRMVHEGG